MLGWNDSRGVLLSWDGTTPGEFSVMEWNDSRGVLLSWNGTTPGESFCPGVERLQGTHSVLTPGFCPRTVHITEDAWGREGDYCVTVLSPSV